MNQTWRGEWAVITGASSGIGSEFARQLAAGGTNLVLTARRSDRLQALAQELKSAHAIQTEICPADLEQPSAPGEICAFVSRLGIEPAVLINNAGFGTFGEFSALDRDREIAMVQVNCAAVVNLTHLFLKGMVARKKGHVLILASTASFQPIPYLANYAATKAFDRYFAEALAEEVRPYGVRVCALSPGATQSEFFDVASMPTLGKAVSAEVVVRRGLEALSKGKPTVVPGFGNWIGAEIQRLVPRRVVAFMTARMFRAIALPGTPKPPR